MNRLEIPMIELSSCKRLLQDCRRGRPVKEWFQIMEFWMRFSRCWINKQKELMRLSIRVRWVNLVKLKLRLSKNWRKLLSSCWDRRKKEKAGMGWFYNKIQTSQTYFKLMNKSWRIKDSLRTSLKTWTG